jgi:hypothetical protein
MNSITQVYLQQRGMWFGLNEGHNYIYINKQPKIWGMLVFILENDQHKIHIYIYLQG